MSDEEAPREVVPQQRLYNCFCEKRFTTYPGLYLHLKSKHTNLFPKYKRQKITKLFRKAVGPNGAELFYLDPLPQKEVHPHERKPREPRKKSQAPVEDYQARRRSTREDHALGITLRDRQAEAPPQKRAKKMEMKVQAQPQSSESPPQQSPPAVSSSSVQQQLPQQNLPDHYETQRRAYLSLQAHAQAQAQAHVQPHPLHFNPNLLPPQAHTIKRCLERFLLESDQPFAMKLALKNTLYNLMVFLDKNYESLGDPRVRDKLFLSYCEDHDLSRAGPLIRQYYSHFQTRSQMPDETVQERVQRTQLGKLGLWLRQQGLADLHLEQPHPTRRTRRRRDRDSDDSFEPEDDASEVVESRPNARRRNHPSSSPPRP